jgi:hypothetical protein
MPLRARFGFAMPEAMRRLSMTTFISIEPE